MAIGTYRAPDINRALTYIGPHGNVAHKSAPVLLPAAAVIGNTIDFMVLQRGAQILDCIVSVLGATNAGVLFELGLAQIPGKSAVKVDPDGLIVATTAATATIIRRNKTTVALSALLLDDDYLVQGTISGANNAAGAVIECTVFYENVGTP